MLNGLKFNGRASLRSAIRTVRCYFDHRIWKYLASRPALPLKLWRCGAFKTDFLFLEW